MLDELKIGHSQIPIVASEAKVQSTKLRTAVIPTRNEERSVAEEIAISFEPQV